MQDSLVHMIVHDLRSPLTSMLGFLDLLLTDPPEAPEERAMFLKEAAAGAARMSEMVSSLLDVKRLEAGEMPVDARACDLGPLCTDVLRSLGGLTIGRRVAWHRPEHPIVAHCDADLISRVIGNLVANAVKFTPQTADISLTLTTENGRVRVTVADNGPGIPSEALSRIFDKFGQGPIGRERRRYSSGLGLAFCKLAVEAHGGTIGVDTAPGAGASFWFELPAGPSPQHA